MFMIMKPAGEAAGNWLITQFRPWYPLHTDDADEVGLTSGLPLGINILSLRRCCALVLVGTNSGTTTPSLCVMALALNRKGNWSPWLETERNKPTTTTKQNEQFIIVTGNWNQQTNNNNKTERTTHHRDWKKQTNKQQQQQNRTDNSSQCLETPPKKQASKQTTKNRTVNSPWLKRKKYECLRRSPCRRFYL